MALFNRKKDKKQQLQKRNESVPLCPEGIDQMAALLTESLSEAGVSRKDTLRLRLAVEDIMALWQSKLEDGMTCVFQCGTRLGRMYLRILLKGDRIDPAEQEEEQAGELLYSNLLAQAGLALVYSYKSGQNCLEIHPPKQQRISPLVQLLLAITAAVGLGMVGLVLPQTVQTTITAVTEPLFTAMMGILQSLAGPMIFLSVCWGILCMGDIRVLGTIGRVVILRFLAAIYILLCVVGLSLVWLFQSGDAASSAGENAASQVYHMILQIIPSNIIAPFLEGNSLQIIFMAVCVGVVLLVLKEKLPVLHALVEQLNSVIQSMMRIVSRYLPIFTFISLFSLILSNSLNGLGGVVKGLLIAIANCVLCPLVYALVTSLRLKVSFPLLLKKLLPTYLIALATASSSAALSTNLETCERRLGISQRLTGFAVPLGQVVFKTGFAVGFFILVMGIAEYYGVAITLPWMITGILVTGLLAIATPPVPGGGLTCYTILLTQLGLPAEAIALAVAANTIMDFFMTSCGISCLQSELLLQAHHLGMLDREVLKKRNV